MKKSILDCESVAVVAVVAHQLASPDNPRAEPVADGSIFIPPDIRKHPGCLRNSVSVSFSFSFSFSCREKE